MVRPKPGAVVTDAPPWYAPRYRNRGRLDEYLGDTQAHYLEILTVEWVNVLTGKKTLDWSYEPCSVAVVRELGPGLRVSNFLTAFYIVVLSSCYLDTPLVGQHVMLRDERDAQFGNGTLNVTFVFWLVSHALLVVGFWLIRSDNPAISAGDDCTPFYRLPVRELWEVRVNRQRTFYSDFSGGVMTVLYFCYFVLASLATHTVLAHMYVERNPWFAALLLLQVLFTLVASFDDATQIGGPYGIQEASKTASIVLCARFWIIIPLLTIWSVGSVFAAFPPYNCIECTHYVFG